MTEAFRIGCCYRQRDGVVVRIEFAEGEDLTCRYLNGPRTGKSSHRYSNGAYWPYGRVDESDLLPGEVTESGEPVNPAFVPFRVRCVELVDENGLESVYLTVGERYEVRSVRPDGHFYVPVKTYSGTMTIAYAPIHFVREDSPAEPALNPELARAIKRYEDRVAKENTTERIRDPLTWATPQPFDAFPGFVVKSDEWDSEFNGEHFGTLGGVSLDTPSSLFHPAQPYGKGRRIEG